MPQSFSKTQIPDPKVQTPKPSSIKTRKRENLVRKETYIKQDPLEVWCSILRGGGLLSCRILVVTSQIEQCDLT